MGVEDTPGKYQLNELDNKLVNALVEMWRKSSLNHLDCEAIELAMEIDTHVPSLRSVTWYFVYNSSFACPESCFC